MSTIQEKRDGSKVLKEGKEEGSFSNCFSNFELQLMAKAIREVRLATFLI